MPALNNFISQNVVTIFSMSWCPYCTRAKQLMKSLGLKTKVYEVDLNEVPDNVIQELQQKSNHKTWPNIFIGNDSVKGFSDVQALINQGHFDQLVKKNNILKDSN